MIGRAGRTFHSGEGGRREYRGALSGLNSFISVLTARIACASSGARKEQEGRKKNNCSLGKVSNLLFESSSRGPT